MTHPFGPLFGSFFPSDLPLFIYTTNFQVAKISKIQNPKSSEHTYRVSEIAMTMKLPQIGQRSADDLRDPNGTRQDQSFLELFCFTPLSSYS